MRVIYRKSRYWSNISYLNAFRRRFDLVFVFSIFISSILSLLLITNSAFAGRIPISDTVSATDPLLKQQGGGSPTQYGDFVSTDDTFTVYGDPPQYIGVQSAATSGTANSLQINIPAGNANDLLLLAVSKEGPTTSTISCPTGWTSINGGACSGTDQCYLRVCRLISVGSETSVTVTWTGAAARAAGGVIRYRGVNTTTPINVSSFSTTGSPSLTPTAPSVTTTAPNTRVVRIMAAEDDVFSAYPTVHTGRFAAQSSETGDPGECTAAADTIQGFYGATGTAAFTLSGTENENWRAGTVAIQPPSYSTNALNGPFRYYIEVVPTASRLVVDIFDADVGMGGTGEGVAGRDRILTGSWDTTVQYRLFNPSGTQVTTNFTTGNTTLPPASDNVWLRLYDSVTTPQTGHWLLEVDTSASTGTNVVAYGVRAHDGNDGSGGVELNVYADPFITYGVNNPSPHAHLDNIYTTYPYITGGGYNSETGACTISINEFDMDAPTAEDEGQITIYTRGNRLILDIGNDQLSPNNTWVGHETSAIDGAGPYYRNVDNGIFRSIYTIGTYPNSPNYTVYYCNNYPGTPPTSLTVFAYRHYFPTDAGAAPVKPYLEQELTYVSGSNPPAEGQTTIIQNTVRIVNPTLNSITFGGGGTPPKLVSVTIPDQRPAASVFLYQVPTATSGTITHPGVGNPGLITWDPGTVANNTTQILTYQMSVSPSDTFNPNQVIYVTGQPQFSNGTQAVFLDETGNASQARATVTFGLLCGLSITEGGSITYASLSSFRAYTDRGKTRVEWETSGEAGTVGFILTRFNESSQKFEPVHEGRIRGLMTAPQGGTYSVIDPGAVAGGKYTYKLIEIQSNGGRNEYGPFEVMVDGNPVDLGAAKKSSSRSTNYSSFEPSDNIWKEPEGVVREARKVSQQSRLQGDRAHKTNSLPLAYQPGRKKDSQAKLAVQDTGLYELTASQIADAFGSPDGQVRTWIRNGNLLITNRGTQITYLSVDNGAALQFFGEAIDSPYTQENIYWVKKGSGSGLMKIQQGVEPTSAQPGQIFTETIHVEKDMFAAPIVPVSPGKDFWYWKILYGGSSETFDVPTPGVAPNGEATLRVYVQGAISDPTLNEHQANVSINGVLIGTQSWDNIATQTLVFQFNSSLLAESNTIEVLSSTSSGYYLDAFDITYPRYATARNNSLLFNADMEDILTVNGFSNNQIGVLDITNPKAPTLIEGRKVESFEGGYRVSFSPTTEGGRYLVLSTDAVREPLWFSPDASSSLKDVKNKKDYLIISPAVLKASAESLATYRASYTGLQTQIALLEDIYDEFNHGIVDPYAIRAFLQYAYYNWERVPRYVVLLGKGTYDYKDVTGQGTNLLPPLMTSTPEGMFASDNRFADVVGDDGVPEYAIGRIPVVSNEEFNAYLAKLLSSELNRGSWGNNVLLTAEVKDVQSDFKADVQVLGDIVAQAGGKSITEIYLDDYTLPLARTTLQDALNVTGMAVMAHLGHGGMDRLATGGLLMISDVQSNLRNATQLPFLIALSCLINRYEVPGIDPMLGETLVIAPNGGASAVWAPTGTSFNSYAAILGEELFVAIYEKGIGRVGDAVVEAMRSFRSQLTGKPVMLDVYTVLGDPAALIAGQPTGTQQGPSNPIVRPVQPPSGG